MKSLLNIVTLLFVIALFALPVMAQDESTEVPAALVFAIPPMLATLIMLNNRGTEFVKLWLSAPSLPVNFDKETQRVIVLGSSIVIGLVLALFIPNANSWLPENFQENVVAAVLLSTAASCFGGAFAQYVLMVLSGVAEWFKAAKSVYSTSTTISSPSTESSDETNKNVMSAVSQAVSN